MVVCRKCSKTKKTTEFYKDRARIQSKCKDCAKIDSKNVRDRNKNHYKDYYLKRRTKNITYIFSRRYSSILRRIKIGYMKDRGDNILSRKDFNEWCRRPEVMDSFIKIYCEWLRSGFINKLNPTIDRIDTSKTYSMDNIQWMTLSNNTKKLWLDYDVKVNGRTKKRIVTLKKY